MFIHSFLKLQHSQCLLTALGLLRDFFSEFFQDMPELEDVDVSEQIASEQATRINIVDVTDDVTDKAEPEDIPLIKPKTAHEEEGIFSSKSEFLVQECLLIGHGSYMSLIVTPWVMYLLTSELLLSIRHIFICPQSLKVRM